MANWLKKHWIKILIVFTFVCFICEGMLGLIGQHKYKQQIREMDATISELWGKIGDSKKREDKWMVSSEKNWDLAMEKEAKLRRKDKEMMVKIHEKRALQKKIREMPLTQVIVRTIEIINCPDVMQQQQGIVFTLICSKKNLTILESTFSLKEKVVDWTVKFNTSQAEVSDLKNVITDKDGVIKEVREQLVGEDKIITEWTGKFDLSEKRGKRSWWKGFKKGIAYGGIAGGIIVFFLRK